MPRSSSPLALSVASLTEVDDPIATAANITQFDDKDFAFSHDRTWNTLPVARTGAFKASVAKEQLSTLNSRIKNCIVALCELGESDPVSTRRFADFPGAGLRDCEGLEFGDIIIKARATCWYNRGDEIVIPILQPRMLALDSYRLGVYANLVRMAYCQGPWEKAQLEMIDLSGESKEPVFAKVLTPTDIDTVSPSDTAAFVRSYLRGLEMAQSARAAKAKSDAARPKMPEKLPLLGTLEIEQSSKT